MRVIDPATGRDYGGIGSQSVTCMWMPDGSLLTLDWRGDIEHWTQRRPPEWWGVAALPPFWFVLVATIACVWRWAVELRRWYRPGGGG